MAEIFENTEHKYERESITGSQTSTESFGSVIVLFVVCGWVTAFQSSGRSELQDKLREGEEQWKVRYGNDSRKWARELTNGGEEVARYVVQRV